MTEYDWRYGKPKGIPQHIVRKVYSSLRVYFPTRKTVAESKGGLGTGVSCFSSLNPACQNLAVNKLVWRRGHTPHVATNIHQMDPLTPEQGTICLQSSWWNSDTFPRSIFRDCQSKRPNMLMHNKAGQISLRVFTVSLGYLLIHAVQMLFARLGNANASRLIAWAYIGSANLSASAWYVVFSGSGIAFHPDILTSLT